MYLSDDKLALADQAVKETFEQTSIAWQAIPHWDTGDPGAETVRNDVVDDPKSLALVGKQKPFTLTPVQIAASTPDSLLAEVVKATAELAGEIDKIVLQELYTGKGDTVAAAPPPPPYTLNVVVGQLINARAKVEDAGYRAPACLITNTQGLIVMSELAGGYPATEGVLTAANVNSLHRATKIDEKWATDNPEPKKGKLLMLMIGRRQRIAHGDAPNASPGEEPVDLAVSVMPSLEVVGEAAGSLLQLAVRIRFATRIKDAKSIVAVTGA